MELRSEAWRDQWATHQDEVVHTRLELCELRRQALEEALIHEPPDADALEAGARLINTNTALGADAVAPTELLAMPKEGWEPMARLFRQVEREATLPYQALVNIMACLPKPQGGERTFALMAMLFRTYCRARRDDIRQWDKGTAGHWDKAVANNSALRAALWCRLGEETCSRLGGHCASAFVDVDKFYDSLAPSRVIRAMLD